MRIAACLSLVFAVVVHAQSETGPVLSFSAEVQDFNSQGEQAYSVTASPTGVPVEFLCQKTGSLLDCWVSRPPVTPSALITIRVRSPAGSISTLFSGSISEVNENGDIYVSAGDVSAFTTGDLLLDATFTEKTRQFEVTFSSGPFDKLVNLAKFTKQASLTRVDGSQSIPLTAIFTYYTAGVLGLDWLPEAQIVPGVQLLSDNKNYHHFQVVGYTTAGVVFAFECDTPLSVEGHDPVCGTNSLESVPTGGVITGNELRVKVKFDA